MGAVRPQTPNQEQCPWTLSVGASHTRYEAGDTPAARKHPGQLRMSKFHAHTKLARMLTMKGADRAAIERNYSDIECSGHDRTDIAECRVSATQPVI